MHTSIYAYNANWGASTKNRSKTNRKSLRNRPQNGPKSVPNRSKIGPRSASEPTSLPTSILDRLGTVFGPFWARSWRPLGGLSGVKLGSSWSKNRFLEVLDGVQKRTWCWIPFWTDFWSVWEPFGGRKWSQNRSSIGLKSDHDIKTRVLVLTHKNQWFLHIFGHRGDRKSIKNRSKSHLKAVLSWDAERTRKNHPKWLQHGSKNDPSWRPKTLWAPSGGRPRAKKERPPRRDQKTTRHGPDIAKKDSKKTLKIGRGGLTRGGLRDCKFARIGRIWQRPGSDPSQLHPAGRGRRIHLPCGPTPPPCLGVKLVS